MGLMYQSTSSTNALLQETTVTHGDLIDALSGYIETLSDGTVIYRNARGETHRTTGPAIIQPNGDEYWYQNGKRHRIDGPAVVRADGTRAWYQQGLLHRTDGAAVLRADGTRAWYVRGSFMSYTLFQHLATLGDVHDT